MNLHSALTCLAIAPAILTAQAPNETPKALVAKYAALLEAYPQMLKDEDSAKHQIPLEDSVLGISVRIAHESRPEIRLILLVARHFMLDAKAPKMEALPDALANYASTLNTAFALELAGQVPPDSPALELVALRQPGFLGFMAWHASGGGFADQTEDACADKAFTYLSEVAGTNPSRMVKALALTSGAELASRARMIPLVEVWAARLEAFDPAHPDVAKWKKWVADARAEDREAPKVGKNVPAFEVQNLDQPKEVLTPERFRGKYFILDFWATWCGPCKGELPFVHKAYAKYHSAGLEILSISSDRKAEDIFKFRKDPDHPMPWLHAFPQGPAAEKLMKTFQVRGIPYVLLIGPDGKILETVENLRGEQLDQTLGKYLHAK